MPSSLLKKDFEMMEGTNLTIKMTATDKETELPIDITGWSIYFSVFRSKASSNAYISKISTSGTQISKTEPMIGKFEVYIEKDDFGVSPEVDVSYYWECIGVTPGGQEFEIDSGNVKFRQRKTIII